jgi:methylmalonyl-CoA mutase N-terminal domain/subunit
MADADCERQSRWSEEYGSSAQPEQQAQFGHNSRRCGGSYWSDAEWRVGADGKARRVKSDLCLLVDGFPNRVASLRIAGNAIVPILAAEVIAALMETLDD